MHRREHWSERELSGCAPREVRVLTEGSQLLTAKMGRKLLCIAFRGMERFTATRGRPHIGQMKRMWHMAVVAVLTRTLDRIAQAGWTCHGSSRLRISPRLLRKIPKWYGSTTSRDRRFWTGLKGVQGWARIWHHCGLWWESGSHPAQAHRCPADKCGRKLQEGNGGQEHLVRCRSQRSPACLAARGTLVTLAWAVPWAEEGQASKGRRRFSYAAPGSWVWWYRLHGISRKLGLAGKKGMVQSSPLQILQRIKSFADLPSLKIKNKTN